MAFVYLINIERTDLYKIGITRKTIKERMKSLQTGSPFKLFIIDFYETDMCQKIETILHRNFKHKKYVSEDFENLIGEWFQLTFEDVKDFREKCQKIEDNVNYLKVNSTFDITKIL